MSTVPERDDIDEQYKWDLSDLFADETAFEQSVAETEELIDELATYEGRVTEDPETLADVLDCSERLMRTVSNVATYTRLKTSEDTRNQEYQALSARAESLTATARSTAGFIDPELQECSATEIEEMIEANPALEEYEQYFDDVLRMKPHTRSTAIEQLLGELSEVTSAPSEIYKLLTNADMRFPTVEDPSGDAVEITQANFTTLQKTPDRAFRKEVYTSFYDEWETVRNAVGAALKNSVTNDVKQAQAHNYDTAREAALHPKKIPPAVYDTLVGTVNDNLDTLHQHLELKREVLGVDALRMWDVYMSLTGNESPEISYEQASEYVTAAVSPLGEDYQNQLADGLESRWVDVYENAGKQSGAYSSGTYDTQPYIMMNYQDDISSLFTLAHELGHSMHSYYSNEHQPFVYANYEIFVAEVASTVNETLLTHHLLETVEDETLRRHVLDEYLERFRSTLLRQTMFAEFEHRVHEIVEGGGALTPDRFDECYGELKGRYLDPVVMDDRIAREWMRIPHFYMGYYVYQYATGISAAVAIVEQLLDPDQPDAADRYLDFLSSGSSDYPLELLREAGVDMASPAPIETAFETYESYLDRYDSLV
ncbi:oligoendopeptidase F [Halocatena halophila]|uniref:oligoendopeptidase F n=1 Tax=Halocatena halophila TaxID=2814576 RepID=UPI002ED5F57C